MLRRAMMAQAAGGGTDPYWANVVSLLHFDGADGSTTFTDQTGKTWTPSGNAQIDTAQSKFGGASGLFDGGGDYLVTPASSDLEFGSGNGTIELWFNPLALPPVAGGLIQRDNSSGYANFSISYRASGRIEAYFSLSSLPTAPAIISSSVTLTIGQWHHIAFVKVGLTHTLYINGVNVGSVNAGSHPPTGLTKSTYIGSFDASNYFVNGHIDELRITKGVARYTASFTPPTAPFPDS